MSSDACRLGGFRLRARAVLFFGLAELGCPKSASCLVAIALRDFLTDAEALTAELERIVVARGAGPNVRRLDNCEGDELGLTEARRRRRARVRLWPCVPRRANAIRKPLGFDVRRCQPDLHNSVDLARQPGRTSLEIPICHASNCRS
jgi:hypothetical protein